VVVDEIYTDKANLYLLDKFKVISYSKVIIKYKLKTLKVNLVAYIFPPERVCHRLRAGSGFGYMSKFGTGVACRIWLTAVLIAARLINDRPGQLRYS